MRKRFIGGLVLLLLCAVVRAEGPAVVSVEADQPFKHQPSGLTFPAEAGGLRRAQVNRFDEAGKNIAISYRSAERFALIASVYPTGGQKLEEHYKQAKAEVFKVNPTAELVLEDEVSIKQGEREIKFKHAIFTLNLRSEDGKKASLRSDTYLLNFGNWFLKYRLTYLPGGEKQAHAGTEALLRAVGRGE